MFGFQPRSWRKTLSTFVIGIGSATAIAVAADNVADMFLGKVRAGIVADVADFRGIACMESVERTRYAPRNSNRNATCGDLPAAAGASPGGLPEWRSRLRLDVTAGPTSEDFSLTEAGSLERTDVGSLLAAARSGSGEFSGFLRSLIGGGAQFQSRGLQQTPIGKLMVFGFAIPPSAGPAYRGSVFATAEAGDLKRLVMEAENVGEACRVQYTIDYKDTRIGDRDLLLPQRSAMEMVSKDGTETRSETYYSGCRRPVSNPVAPPAGVPKPMPSNVRLRIRFQPPLDSDTAATGDPVTGVIRATVKDKQNGIIVHAGDRVHGRIALIEQLMSPQPHWNIAVAFETIERGVGDHGIDQGIEQPVSLVPLDDGDRTPHDEAVSATDLQKLRPAGGGYFIFHGQRAVLDQRFETEWETR